MLWQHDRSCCPNRQKRLFPRDRPRLPPLSPYLCSWPGLAPWPSSRCWSRPSPARSPGRSWCPPPLPLRPDGGSLVSGQGRGRHTWESIFRLLGYLSNTGASVHLPGYQTQGHTDLLGVENRRCAAPRILERAPLQRGLAPLKTKTSNENWFSWLVVTAKGLWCSSNLTRTYLFVALFRYQYQYRKFLRYCLKCRMVSEPTLHYCHRKITL